MLCTNCSKPIKPVVAVDIDGTLGDYHEHFINFSEGFLGRKLPRDFDGTVPFNEALGLEKSLYRELKLAYRQGGLKRTMPMFPNADKFISALRDAGIEVWLTTTRPYLRFDRIDPDTRAWLERNSIEYDALVYDEDKYQQLLTLVDKERIIAVVEDLPELVNEAAGLDINPIFRQTYWNRGKLYQPAFTGYGKALVMIKTRAKEWHGKQRVGVHPS